MIATLPNHCIGVSVGSDIRPFEHTFEKSEQIAAICFGTGNIHQVDHLILFFVFTVFGHQFRTEPKFLRYGATSSLKSHLSMRFQVRSVKGVGIGINFIT